MTLFGKKWLNLPFDVGCHNMLANMNKCQEVGGREARATTFMRYHKLTSVSE